MNQEFDQWLEDELDTGFAALSSRPVPSEPRYRRIADARSNFLSSVFARLRGSRFLAPALAAALITGGGTAAAAAATGTNPVEFGQQVSQAVVSCKDQLTSGERGVGECVSDFVLSRRPDHPSQAGRQAPERDESDRGRSGTSVSSPATVAPDNHGSAVSDAARSSVSGEGPGGSVSEAARENAPGQQSRDEAPGSAGRGNAAENAGQGQSGGPRGNEDAGGQDQRNAAAGESRGSSPAASALTPTPTPTVGADSAARRGDGGRASERSRGSDR